MGLFFGVDGINAEETASPKVKLVICGDVNRPKILLSGS